MSDMIFPTKGLARKEAKKALNKLSHPEKWKIDIHGGCWGGAEMLVTDGI